jgi:hypothetical protein
MFTLFKVTDIRWMSDNNSEDLPKEKVLSIEDDWIEEQSQSLFDDSDDYATLEEAQNEIIETAIYEDLESEYTNPVIDFNFQKL